MLNHVAIALLMHWLDFACAAGGSQIRSALLGAIYHKVGKFHYQRPSTLGYCEFTTVWPVRIELFSECDCHWKQVSDRSSEASNIESVLPQTLVASCETSRQFNTGDVLNLISVDVDHIFEFAQTSTMIWGGVIRILSSIVLIWFQLGPSCLAGLFVIIAFVPLTLFLGRSTIQYQVSETFPTLSEKR